MTAPSSRPTATSTGAGIEERLDRLYRPYHAAYARLAARRPDTVILAIHSFTPCLKGRAPRPWHVGVLHSHLDSRLSRR
jgi:predicted N-formylglutamate amidohydrolase